MHRNPLQVLNGFPNYCIVRDVFSLQECNSIVDGITSQLNVNDGKLMGDTTNKSIRDSTVRWLLCQPENKWVFDKVDEMLTTANKEWFNFNLIGYTGMQFTEYADSNQHYDWHTDRGSNNLDSPKTEANLRKLSTSIMLCQQEYDFEGGDFQIDAPLSPTTLYLDKGDAVVFPSFVWHRVTPVSKGVRNSLVCWAIGPSFI